jgi:hypothetical protein
MFETTGGGVVNGMAPLVVRSNTHYVCGDDGSSANSCVLRGGQVQALSSYGMFSEAATNCLFKGITFQNATGAGASLANVGDVTFDDCIFKVRGVAQHPFSLLPKFSLCYLVHEHRIT